MTAAVLGLPRVPPAHDGLQINFCKTPSCVNYGVPVPLTVATGRGARNPYTSGGTPQVPGATCTACGTYFPFKSNEGIVQERNRLRLPPEPDLPSCPKAGCANHGAPVGTPGAYQGYGRSKAGTPRWKCNACGATFSRSRKPTLHHDLASKNRMIFKLLANKVPLRRIADIVEVGQGTVHHRLAFLADQCAAFMADRERLLAEMEIPRLYLSVDRQDYTVNWITRRTRKNITLSAVTSVDNRTGYCFGLHLNYDGTMVPDDAEADAVAINDAIRPPPWRKYARIWLRNDYIAAAAKAYRKQASGATLGDVIDDGYAIAGARDDVESPDAPDRTAETLPQDGVQTRLEYTLYGHFLHLHELCPKVGKWRFALDQDSGMRAACLGAFQPEIKARTCDAFYVRINKALNIDGKRQAALAARQALEAAMVANPGLSKGQVVHLLFKQGLSALSAHGPWSDRWLVHPVSTGDEPEKATCLLTDFGDYDPDHLASLHALQSMRGIDSLFNRIRRHASMFERPIHTASSLRTWSGYQPYRPAQAERMLLLLRACHNFVWAEKRKGETKKMTPAMRLGIARAPLDYEDIIHFVP